MKPETYKERNKDIQLSTWFKWSIGIIVGMIMASNAYVYAQVLPAMVTNIITNDRESLQRDKSINDEMVNVKLKIERLGILEEKIDVLGEDMKEIKTILRRSTPYERNGK